MIQQADFKPLTLKYFSNFSSRSYDFKTLNELCHQKFHQLLLNNFFIIMKNISIVFSFLMLSLFILSCSTAEQKEEKKLLDQIHLLHDVETMPKINMLRNLIDDLDKVRTADNSKNISLLKKGLNDADDLMHNWMTTFNWQSEQTPIENRIIYYDAEVKKLETLKDKMNSSMENAEKYLKDQ